MKIMASGPITSWQMDGKTMGTVTVFIWGGEGAPKSLLVTVAMKFIDAYYVKEKLSPTYIAY